MIFPTWTPQIKGANSISVLEQVQINGTDHELMIRGEDQHNPLVIVVHGGPGVSEIPFVNKYQDLLEKDFTIVHYDQRASGKSYHFGEDYSKLSTELLVEDLLAVTDYITTRFNQQKVILMGHSFGTYIGLQAAEKAPEKYEAYIGIGQMSNVLESEIESLNYTIEQASKSGNTEDAAYLQGLTKDIESGERLTPREYVRKYGGAARLINDNKDMVQGLLLGTEYNLLDAIRYMRGAVAVQDILINEAIQKPLPNLVTRLDVPMYFIMGQYDYMTTMNAAKTYFDLIEAEEKEFIIYEHSAHYPQFEEKEKLAAWMAVTFIK